MMRKTAVSYSSKILLTLFIMMALSFAWQVVIPSEEDRARATDENNPYVDACTEANGGAACSYCCLVSKGECSRDIRACDPILVNNRHFENFYIMLLVILSVVCGCPLFAAIMNCCITVRFLKDYYPNTNGVTLMELFCRGFLLICCVRFDKTHK
jgi:hypothetical protein